MCDLTQPLPSDHTTTATITAQMLAVSNMTEFAAGDWLRGTRGSISVVGDGSSFQREWVPDRLAD
jgi:hypothetical protein